jgi:hypothetical protein
MVSLDEGELAISETSAVGGVARPGWMTSLLKFIDQTLELLPKVRVCLSFFPNLVCA